MPGRAIMQRCFQGIVICNVGTYYCYPVFNDIRPGQGGCRTRHRLASCVSVWFRCSQVMMMMMMTKNDDDNLGFRTSQLLAYSALADINLFGTIRGWLVRCGLMRETVPELFSVKAHTKHQQLLTNVGVCSIRRNGFESESQLESESESELELIF